jgi:uncharacterized paraquat-inducible protein A
MSKATDWEDYLTGTSKQRPSLGDTWAEVEQPSSRNCSCDLSDMIPKLEALKEIVRTCLRCKLNLTEASYNEYNRHNGYSGYDEQE